MNKSLILGCEQLDNPPVAEHDIGEDGSFNIHLDQMDTNQWYSFSDEFGDMVYIQREKDHIFDMIQIEVKKPSKSRLIESRKKKSSLKFQRGM